MMNLLAQKEKIIGDTFQGLGPLGNPGDQTKASETFNKFISNAIGVMTVIAAVWFIFQFMGGTISYLSSGGDKAKAESARATMTTGVVGLVIVVAAIFLIEILGKLIGFDILNPAEIILELNP